MAEHGLVRSVQATFRHAGRPQGLIFLVILFIFLSIATAGVTMVLTGPDWTSLWESLLIGLLFGWVLAIIHQPAWRSALLVVVLGLFASLFIAGGLNGKVAGVFEGLFRAAGSLPDWIKTGQIDLSLVSSPTQQLITAVGVVFGRVVTWLREVATGEPVFDPVAAGIVWCLVIWLVSAWAGWVVETGNSVILAILPALGLNLTTLSYGRSNTITVYFLLGLTLVLIAVVQFSQHQHGWDSSMVAYPQHKGREIGNLAAVISIGLVLLSAIIASISFHQIVQWTSELKGPAAQHQSGLAKSLGIQQPTPSPDAFSSERSPGLPRDLLIGAGPQLSEELVMSVQVSGFQSQSKEEALPPLYWRSFTYDVYTGHGWSSSPTGQIEYQPNQPIQAAQLPGHELISEEVILQPGQSGTLYAAGEPVMVDASSSAAWRSASDLFGIQLGGTSYTVQSLVPVVSEDSLRAAGQDYPAWVTQRYLELPPEVPDRVKQLAIQLTAAEPTPYDRAHAIEQYLRNNYAYTTDVPHPPANQDLADYFLFDLRKGYCDNFASAMVVLARAAGIPARLAVGFSSGKYNLNSQRFIVSEANAHSWVEVYFPGIGWMPFEPTAALPAINRSAQQNQPPTVIPPKIQRPPALAPSGLTWRFGYSISLGLLSLICFAWAVYDEVHLKLQTPQRSAAEIYRRLKQYGNLLKIPAGAGQTPDEYYQAIAAKINTLSGKGAWRIPSIISDIKKTIQYIVRMSYRPSEMGDTLKLQLVHQWRALRWWLRLVWIWSLWISFRQLFFNKDASITTGASADGR